MNQERYRSLNREFKERFGRKIYKIALNGGMTCPNRDGTLGSRGCIFCSAGGSGDFTAVGETVTEQIVAGKQSISQKMPASALDEGPSYIAYFQAFTNTYGPVNYLKSIFEEAIRHPDIAGLSIGTRPDCLPTEVCDLLGDLAKEKPVWVELGLQTIREDTAEYIRRGYPLTCFEEAVKKLKERGLLVVVHLIIGLPGEGREDLLAAIEYLNRLPIDGIKLQLLHILEGTDLAEEFRLGKVPVLDLDTYASWIASAIARLRSDVTVHRITGDGPKKILLAPLWSGDKKRVLNRIRKELSDRDIYQGCDYVSEEKRQGTNERTE